VNPRALAWRGAAVVLAVAVVLLMPHLLGTYYLTLLTESLIYGVTALSLDLVWGYTGIPDLGHALWFGIGALSVGMMTTTLGEGGLVLGNHGGLGRHVAGIGIGVAVAAGVALLVALLSFSQREADPFYIAIVTLALTVIAGTLYTETSQWTGGDNGLFGFAYHKFSIDTWYYIAAVFLAVAMCGALVFVRSDFGLVLRAIRDHERRIRFFGVNVEAVKTSVFILGAMLAAASGGLYATIVGFVSSPLFGFLFSTQILIWVAVGGRGTIVGPVIGAIGLSFVTAKLSATYPTEWSLFLGLLFVAVVVFTPDGVLPPLVRQFRRAFVGRLRRGPERTIVGGPPKRPELLPAGEQIASARGVVFSYGALQVLRGVDLEMRAGELLCVVGPNGAGKSTLLGVLTDGKLPADGTVEYFTGGRTLSRRGTPIHRIARAGIARKFQIPRLFDSLSVAETVLLAARAGRVPSVWRRTREVVAGRSVLDILEATGLTGREDALSPALAHGLKQGLELAAAVAMRPEILLLDEPTAGLTSNERHVIGDVFRRLVGAGMTIVLIEHDLDFVARVADRVIVLHGGKVVESGTPDEVSQSQVVREAYVGSAAT
jgi:ABC-type branched-subunit amino acid transport system permease subunit/ABC-type branched-subunit amino acid transport system ATPase component